MPLLRLILDEKDHSFLIRLTSRGAINVEDTNILASGVDRSNVLFRRCRHLVNRDFKKFNLVVKPQMVVIL